MAIHIATVMSASLSMDKGTNLLSLFELIESAQVNAKPDQAFTINAPCKLVILTARSEQFTPEMQRARVSFVHPDGKVLNYIDMDIDLSKSYYHRAIVTVESMTVIGPGVYQWMVSHINGETITEVGRYPFIVECNPPAE